MKKPNSIDKLLIIDHTNKEEEYLPPLIISV